jgi:hypothetical protein
VTARRTALARTLAVATVAVVACGRGGESNVAGPQPLPIAETGLEGFQGDVDAAPSDPLEIEAWRRAAGGDEDELVRLASLLGCTGLRERAGVASLRPTALRAMGACDGESELGWLAGVAQTGKGADAMAALDAIVELVARPRRALDPDDAEEIVQACRALLALARSPDHPKSQRVKAVSALRMLADRGSGCVRPSDIPAELDAK